MTGLAPRVWAPLAERVELVLPDRRLQMQRGEDDWFGTEQPLRHGDRYAFAVDGADPVPDPRSVWLPDGVHQPNAAYDHGQFGWTDDDWQGARWEGAVLYELHVGTFTADGSFDGAIERLEHLVDLGVTHIELMPVCAFDGQRGWGYDGVAPWSVHEPYGGPDGLKRFVDAAHRHGLAVVLDVVHNHLGPSGNYLSRFGPYFTDAHHTPWGSAVNLDQPDSDPVREYLLAASRSWLVDFHLDGLRCDAVHELHDHRAVTFLEDLTRLVDDLRVSLDRPLVIIAESDRNDPRTVLPRDRAGIGMHAQWDDDIHHSLHTLFTDESQGYYADFAADPVLAFQSTLDRAFFHAGTFSSFRGRRHGRPASPTDHPAGQFVAFVQNHDQVGNRATGDRISATVPASDLAAAAALLLLGPFTPMLFMGEEWGARTPWQFFTSFEDPHLAEAVTTGRLTEFAEHGWGDDVPDPQDEQTLIRSRLDWTEPAIGDHRALLDWHRELIGLRAARAERGELVPLGQARFSVGPDRAWLRLDQPPLVVVSNRGPDPLCVDPPEDRPLRLTASFGEVSVNRDDIRVSPGATAVLSP